MYTNLTEEEQLRLALELSLRESSQPAEDDEIAMAIRASLEVHDRLVGELDQQIIMDGILANRSPEFIAQLKAEEESAILAACLASECQSEVSQEPGLVPPVVDQATVVTNQYQLVIHHEEPAFSDISKAEVDARGVFEQQEFRVRLNIERVARLNKPTPK